MLMYEHIFNDETLNIFTDASICKTEDETIGCYGIVPITTHKELNNTFPESYLDYVHIARYSTNNDSELRGILSGIFFALQYRQYFKTINLFSDSKISIFGIREWIFNWMHNARNGIMYSTTGEVLNQELIKDIVFTILQNQLNINLFHQKGHVDTTVKKLDNAKQVFIVSNDMNTDVDINLISKISYYNNMIDERTRDIVTAYMKEYYPDYKSVQKLSRAISFDINGFNAKEYSQLIRRK